MMAEQSDESAAADALSLMAKAAIASVFQIPPISDLTSPLTVPLMAPRLAVIKQNALAEEKVVKNGTTQVVKIVVKNSPFYLALGIGSVFSHPDSTISLYNQLDVRQFTFDARLVYDEAENKEVDFVKLKPLEYKFNVSDNGLQLNVEARIKVLTSQLEDMLFRIKFRALDSRTKRELFTALSLPIKVVSKPEQFRKKQKLEAREDAAGSGKKRPITDYMLEALNKIQEKQNRHNCLLSRLLARLSGAPSPPQSEASNLSSPATPREGSEKDAEADAEMEESEQQMERISPRAAAASRSGEGAAERETEGGADANNLDLEASFHLLTQLSQQLAPEQRREKIARVVRELRMSRDTARELHDIFWSQRSLGAEDDFENPNNFLNFPPPLPAECTCADCPHKAELERIEYFYKEIFNIST